MFYYIVQELGDGSSQKAKEMERSKIRSHAATASYRGRRNQSKKARAKAAPSQSSKGIFQARDWHPLEQREPTPGAKRALTKNSSPSTNNDGLFLSWTYPIEQENPPHTKPSRSAKPSSGSHRSSVSIPHDRLGLRCDPFIYTLGGRSYDISMVIDFFTRIVTPNHAPISKIFNVTNTYASYYFRVISPEALLHAGVASIQAILDELRQPGQGPSYVTLNYLDSATMSVRKTINQLMHNYKAKPSDDLAQVLDSTIITMMFLASCSRTTKDWNALRAHRRGISALIKTRGGLDKLTCHGGYARCGLLQMDSFWALDSGDTMFPSHRPDYQPIYPSVPFSADFSSQVLKLPPGFQAMTHCHMLASDLIEILTRTASAQIEYRIYGAVVDPSDILKPAGRRYSDFWEACTCFNAPDDLIQLTSEAGDTINSTSPNLQKLIVLSLILYCLNTFSPERVVTTVYSGSRKKLTSDLPRRYATNKHKRSLGQQNADEERLEEDALLWIGLVVIDSWRGANDKLVQAGKELLKMTKDHYSDFTSWNDVEERLTIFFYNKGFLTRCAGYWECDPCLPVVQ